MHIYYVTRTTLQLCFSCHILEWLQFRSSNRIIETTRLTIWQRTFNKRFSHFCTFINMIQQGVLNISRCVHPCWNINKRSGMKDNVKWSVILFHIWSLTCCSSRFIAAGFISSCNASISVAKPYLSRISELKWPGACRVNVHLFNADYLRANPTIPPFPLDSLIMFFFGCHIALYAIESSCFLVYCKFARIKC